MANGQLRTLRSILPGIGGRASIGRAEPRGGQRVLVWPFEMLAFAPRRRARSPWNTMQEGRNSPNQQAKAGDRWCHLQVSTRKRESLGSRFGGQLANTQPIEKFFAKPDQWGPNGLFRPGTPSSEVGGEFPHLNLWFSRGEEAAWTSKIGL